MCNLARIGPLLAVITGTAVTGCSLDDDRDAADQDVLVSEDVLEIGVADLPAPGSIGTPIEGYAAYDSSIDSVRMCPPSGAYMRPGTRAFSTYLARFGITGNTYNSCQTGFHPRGMALDVFISGTTGKQAFANWLTANNGEMARRLGLVQVIWQTLMWRSYNGGAGKPQGAWGTYGGRPHTDHVHISFGELGAEGATSFFRDVINSGGVARVVVAANADGRLEIFGRNSDGGIMAAHQSVPNGGWSGWTDLGGVNLTGAPAVGANADGRLEVFARNGNGGIMAAHQTEPNGGWSGWTDLGGVNLTGTPAVGANADGRLEVFARNGNGGIMAARQSVPNGGWSGWTDLGGLIVSDPVVGANADGRLEVFARNGNGGIMATHQTVPNGGWSGWTDLGGLIVSDPVVGANADGRLEVFARNSNGGIMATRQTEPNGGWSGWTDLGGVNLTGTPAVGANVDGRLEVFARNGNGGIMAAHQTEPNGGWSGWTDLGGLIVSDPVVGANADGRLEVFARSGDGNVMAAHQTVPNGGWSGWTDLGGLIISSTPGRPGPGPSGDELGSRGDRAHPELGRARALGVGLNEIGSAAVTSLE